MLIMKSPYKNRGKVRKILIEHNEHTENTLIEVDLINSINSINLINF